MQVGFPELVLNAASFAQTVENMFTLSFLVRDNRVALVEDEERGWCVQPLEGGKAKGAQQPPQQQQQHAPQLQFIMSVSGERHGSTGLDWQPAAAAAGRGRAAAVWAAQVPERGLDTSAADWAR